MTTTSTTNYGFVKPTAGTAEPVSVTAHLDDNWDKVDQDMNRFDRQIFNVGTGQTWNKPTRAKRVVVELVGAGASAGGTAVCAGGQFAASSGGGAGGYCKKLFLASVLSASETIDVGAGGVGAAAGNNNGNNGNISRFAVGKAYVVTASGGVAGLGSGAVGGANNLDGGAGGAATGGDINVPGGYGGPGVVTVANGIVANGGSNPLSSSVATIAGASVAGQQYGGGSSGASAGAGPAKPSAAGANGVCIVDTYY